MPDQRINTTRFERVLRGVEKKLSIALDLARDEADHSGIKGDKVEVATRKVLRDHLPPNLNIGGNGIVYDSFGDETGETDIIIANGEQPFTFPGGESGEYAIEGVSAVGEVKSKLTPGELKDCIKKGTTYKRLRQIVATNDLVLNRSQYTLETSLIPPFFVIAHESSMTMETVLGKLLDAPFVPVPEGKGIPGDSPQPPLDAVCILGKGVALNQRSGQGPAFQLSPLGGNPQPGWISAEGDAPLAMTLAWLHMAMPRILRSRSLVGQYFLPPRTQLTYMVNKERAARGLDPITEEDLPPMVAQVIPYKRQPKKAAKAAKRQPKKAAKQQPKKE